MSFRPGHAAIRPQRIIPEELRALGEQDPVRRESRNTGGGYARLGAETGGR